MLVYIYGKIECLLLLLNSHSCIFFSLKYVFMLEVHINCINLGNVNSMLPYRTISSLVEHDDL